MPIPTVRGPYPRHRLRAVSARRNEQPDSGELYIRIGSLLGIVGACIAFFATLGWITAWLAAAVAFILLRHLWPLSVVLLIALLR